jgi:hypothetical protein
VLAKRGSEVNVADAGLVSGTEMSALRLSVNIAPESNGLMADSHNRRVTRMGTAVVHDSPPDSHDTMMHVQKHMHLHADGAALHIDPDTLP